MCRFITVGRSLNALTPLTCSYRKNGTSSLRYTLRYIYIYNFVKIASTNVLTITAVVINYRFRCVDEFFLSIIQIMAIPVLLAHDNAFNQLTTLIEIISLFFLILLLFNYIINILYFNDIIKRKPTTIPCFERNLSAGRLFPRYYFFIITTFL